MCAGPGETLKHAKDLKEPDLKERGLNGLRDINGKINALEERLKNDPKLTSKEYVDTISGLAEAYGNLAHWPLKTVCPKVKSFLNLFNTSFFTPLVKGATGFAVDKVRNDFKRVVGGVTDPDEAKRLLGTLTHDEALMRALFFEWSTGLLQ